MGHAAASEDFNPQRTLRCRRQSILGWLAVDQELAAAALLICNLGAQAVAFFQAALDSFSTNSLRLT